MQKFRKLAYLSILGVGSLLLPCTAYAKVLWEGKPFRESFDFAKYDKVFIAPALDCSVDDAKLLKIFRKAVGKKGSVEALSDPMTQIMGAMGESRLWLFLSLTPIENSDLSILRIEARAGVESVLNRSHLTANVWQKELLLEGTRDLESSLSKAIAEFSAKYFETNAQASGKAVFFLPTSEGA